LSDSEGQTKQRVSKTQNPICVILQMSRNTFQK